MFLLIKNVTLKGNKQFFLIMYTHTHIAINIAHICIIGLCYNNALFTLLVCTGVLPQSSMAFLCH